MSLLALACGGISVHHDETDPGAAETADSPVGKPPAPTPTTQDSAPPDERSLCESICARCIGAGLGQGCQTFCSNVIPEAEAAKCSVAFASLLKCRNKAVDQCALDACPTEDNALTACVLEYCDSHYQADLCVAPI